jgi:hypothetical protein
MDRELGFWLAVAIAGVVGVALFKLLGAKVGGVVGDFAAFL